MPDTPTKPLYRRPWFLTVIVVLALAGLGALLDVTGGDEPVQVPSQDASASADLGARGGTEPTTSVVESGTPESAQLEVPDLVGLNAAIALEELRMAGFTNIQLGSVDEDDTVVLAASNWTVVEQSAVPGAVQTSSDLIVLSCTKE